jgi:DNA-binding NtrC family response regulator
MSESVSLSETPEQNTKRILVVEDHVALRFTLAEWLRSFNYVVFEAASADEAITLLESSLVVDFVVTDVQMPGNTDGFDLVRYINKSFPDLNVIVVSGDDSHKQLKEENIPFFKKPYDLKTLSSHIAKLLNHSNTQNDDYFK